MTHPSETSVNAYLCKNNVMGMLRTHVLPTVDKFVEEVLDMGRGSYRSSTDISRAYKDFKSDPLDWPLLGFSWAGKFFCDITMPFKARSSSCHMQCMANAIVGLLDKQGIKSKMYLDDLIILSPTKTKAYRDLKVAQQLLRDLGLPEARDKIHLPSTAITCF